MVCCHGYRVQEEVGSLRRKLERHRTREWTSTSDEVLLEEIRTYKVTTPPNTTHTHTHTYTLIGATVVILQYYYYVFVYHIILHIITYTNAV